MRVALIHDWLDGYRGGEKVLTALLELFPEAPVFTLFYRPEKMPASYHSRQIYYPKRLNRMQKWRKVLLPILPTMIESFELDDFDLVISSSSCVAKGVITSPHTPHLCYIHSPMRYVWDQRQHYINRWMRLVPFHFLWNHISTYLRLWDTVSAGRVDRFVANSSFVAQRVRKYYDQPAAVLHPPVEIERFHPAERQAPSDLSQKPYFLVAGAFVSYKRFDLAIEACEQLGKRLIVAGSGPAEAALRRLGKKFTHFEIQPDGDRWVELFQNAEALLFPGLEDFGITAIEALAAGTPVIAFQGGGALDFIQPGVTGEFFSKPEVASLIQTLQAFRPERYQSDVLVEYSKDYSKKNFQQQIRHHIDQLLQSKDPS